MDDHSFCRDLLRSAIADYRLQVPAFRSSSLSVTKSSLRGYEVQGDDKFYYYASSACCSWCAKAEAIDTMIQSMEAAS